MYEAIKEKDSYFFSVYSCCLDFGYCIVYKKITYSSLSLNMQQFLWSAALDSLILFQNCSRSAIFGTYPSKILSLCPCSSILTHPEAR